MRVCVCVCREVFFERGVLEQRAPSFSVAALVDACRSSLKQCCGVGNHGEVKEGRRV